MLRSQTLGTAAPALFYQRWQDFVRVQEDVRRFDVAMVSRSRAEVPRRAPWEPARAPIRAPVGQPGKLINSGEQAQVRGVNGHPATVRREIVEPGAVDPRARRLPPDGADQPPFVLEHTLHTVAPLGAGTPGSGIVRQLVGYVAAGGLVLIQLIRGSRIVL